MAKRFPEQPARPERNCWGCDRYCSAEAMLCGNGSERTQHPIELFGLEWAKACGADVGDAPPAEPAPAAG